MDFTEKYGPWALISGASEGTGSEFARLLAAQGLNLILIARREGPLAALAEELTAAHGVECVTASLDLARPDAVEGIRSLIEGREVGLFIANAGGDPNGTPFFDTDAQAWLDLVNRNVVTVLLCCHLLGGLMRGRGRGGIILVGSGACYGGAPGMGVYSGSKAFDLCLGEGLWIDLKPDGVDVLNLILGRTDTPELRRWLASRGAAVPQGLASAAEVARIGLERLPHGPVHNFGLADDEQGAMPQSAAARRQRILVVAEAMKDLGGKK